jgi:predicted dehydrogenase/aryl-alcohol dehydrogenase-like predicted oxidoreductase
VTTNAKLRWGIIGTGAIAKTFARAVPTSQTGQLVAVGSRSQESADAFAEAFGIASGHRHASYEALLADDQVQAVYISTPHPMHAQWAIRAVEAGKAVLCEKPLALNAAQAMAAIEAARERGVFLMEAFMYRCHPQTAKLLELIQGGAIGEVKFIQASFGFRAGFNPEGRLFKNALGGGGIMDVGCYPVSMARLIAGAAAGHPFADPISVTGSGKLAPTGVDESAAAVLSFPGGIIATVATAVCAGLENAVRIFGSEGSIFVPNPWTADRNKGGSFTIHVTRKGETQQVTVDADVTAFAFEADVVGKAVLSGCTEAPAPAMSHADSMGNIRTLDQWRAAAGVVFEAEKPENLNYTVANRPLKVRPDNRMKFGRIAGVDKPVARLLMGVDNQSFMPHAAAMFDDYIERGGNAFDTAFIYGGGKLEANLGWWLRHRGIREQVVILSKGAHTPNCFPDAIRNQNRVSLDRLQVDYVDIYMMHRDNMDIPVGEFVDVLNELKDAGRVRAFGVSNWSIPRIVEALEYAKKNNRTGFSAISNNFSLARMVDPVWAGCIAASDPDSRAWLKQTQMPLMPWSSQARGFFTDRGEPSRADDKEMVRCWHSDDNFRRRQRAIELAQKKGVDPIHIALAYVLNQPFPTFALIGPRQVSETASSFRALDVTLSEDEVKWLNLEQ